jgi:alpha-L-fucosidase
MIGKARSITILASAFLLAGTSLTAQLEGHASAPRPAHHPVPSIQDNETPAQRDARMGWWREARFGMFIHWGLYAVPAGVYKDKTDLGEWFLEQSKMPVSEYAKFIPQFDPEKFDAKAIVKTAKDAGMKYLVITSKHHDGFGMFPSALTDWCIKSTPFKRDPLAELSAACAEAGLRFCTYHSIMDWHSSDWGNRRAWNDTATGTPDMDRFTAYLKGQLTEIVTRYHPGIMWFDGEWEKPWTHARALDLFAFLRKLDPQLIINNRIDTGRNGMAGMSTDDHFVGDYGTPEQEIPATGFGAGVDWESCMTINDHWGFNAHDTNWKSPQTIVTNLVDIASKGGNYLLNVGPTAEGQIPDGSIATLGGVGGWMKVNSEAIYGTTASPFRRLPAGLRCTQKGATLYVHVLTWPADGRVVLPMTSAITSATLLGQTEALATAAAEHGATITLPATAPAGLVPVIKVALAGEVLPIDTLPKQAADGTIVLALEEATLSGGIKIENTPPNLGLWTNTHATAMWTVSVRQPGAFAVVVDYALPTADAGNQLDIDAGGTPLSATLAATGSWSEYQQIEIGTLTVAKAGPVSFTIRAKPRTKFKEGLLNLRGVTLKPKG